MMLFLTATLSKPADPLRQVSVLAQDIAAQLAAQYPMAVSVSQDGSRILVRTDEWNTEKLSVIDRESRKLVGVIESPNAYLALSWSSNRNEIAFLSAEGNGNNFEPYVWKTDEKRAKRLDGPTTNTAIQSIRWSHDGKRLAYLVGNNDDATIWILNAHVPSGAHALAAHIRTLSDFEWSSDGHSIAAVFRNAPFALQIINVDVGQVVATIPIGRGPFSEIRDLAWAPSASVLALSARVDHDFFELVEVDVSTHTVAACALADDGDVLAPHFAEDNKTVIYSVSTNSEISLYATNCRASGAKRLWSQPGTVRFLKAVPKSTGLPTDDDSIFVLYSSLAQPPAVYRIPLSQRKPERIYSPPAALRLTSNAPEIVRIPSSGGALIPTVLWRRSEANAKSGPNFVLVDVHGGPRLQQYRRWEILPALLTKAGVDVISPNYRGSGGYGHRFERADIDAQVADIVATCRYAKSLHGGKSRVILLGISYGAFLAASAAVSDQNDINGLVLLSMVGQQRRAPALRSWKSPLICLYGQNDTQPPQMARMVIESFFGPDIFKRPQNQWRVFAGEGHVFRLTRSWTEAFCRIRRMASIN